MPLIPSRPALRPSSALERCLEAWLQPCFVLINTSLRNQSRSQGPGWLDFILVCHVCLGKVVLILHRATCTFIFSISYFWWSCVAPALHHLHFPSFCFSSAPGEKTTQSAEIGGQTEHPRALLALLAFKRTRQQQQLPQNYASEALVTGVSQGVSSSFLKTICLTEALETAVSRQECGEVTRGRLPDDCCLPRHLVFTLTSALCFPSSSASFVLLLALCCPFVLSPPRPHYSNPLPSLSLLE